ncbi:hypothetical protein CF335_g9280 [Tilletia laevis]|nr:hypothetical protein CF335_g9280 [Tilletia laevis]
MIHCSLEGTDEEEAQDIRTFSDAVADKWGLDISYDFIVRMAWLRKMGSETIPIQSAGAAWWDNVQAELDILVSLCNHQDIAHQQKGQRCFERALQWEFDTHGRCDVLENEQRPAEEAALADDFLHAGEELIDAEEVVD